MLVKGRPRILSIAEACKAVALPRATYYYAIAEGRGFKARRSPRRLTGQERADVLAVLGAKRFCDMSVREVWAALIDEGTYLCSVRTMYRILSENAPVRERRNQLLHPQYTRPELLATGPNQVWSWDITKLKGPRKWTYYYLYVVMDIYSRKVVGWMVAHRESSTLAVKLISETCVREGINRNQLTVHADRGSSMRSKPVAFLLSDLGVTKTHSRPYTSSDNPYSEAQFRTLKYRPEFPQRFGSIEDARVFCLDYFRWYNHEHHHTAIGLMTPDQIHTGQAVALRRQRQNVLNQFAVEHPERFVNGTPTPPALPQAAWINKPKEQAA